MGGVLATSCRLGEAAGVVACSVHQPELIARLQEVLQDGPDLRLALLFGSFARNPATPGSDVDLAVLPVNAELSLADELALQARLSAVVGREVDLVRLDRCAPGLRWRIANEGVPLLASPPHSLPRFRARAGIEHAEFEPQRRRASELFLRRLRETHD
jgi:predicted nucleotidyltransferase